FALSTISCLLFVATSVKVEANLGYAVITLAGPAGLWVLVIMVMTKIWHEPPPMLVHQVPPGWIPFAEWRYKAGHLSYLFLDDKVQYCIREVFNNVFFRYPEKRKLSRPSVQTVFIYYARAVGNMGMVKLQRVVGNALKPPVDLYHVSAPSLPGKDPSSYL